MIRNALLAAALLLSVLVSVGAQQAEPRADAQQPIRFVTYELHVDPAGETLAAWQVRLEDPTGAAKLVGVEGGNDASFGTAPHYDPKALQGGAVVLAAFDTDGTGPNSETLVARVHMAITGPHDPKFNVTAQVVASPAGPIQAGTARLTR